MIRGVIFDLGSTLLYTEMDGQWEQVFPRMDADLLAHLQAQGYALEGERFIRCFGEKFTAGMQQRLENWREITAAEVLDAALAELGAPPLSPLAQAKALHAYYAYSESLWHPMPGVYETLDALAAAGHRLAILSNASDDANVQRLIDGARLRHYFSPIVVSAAMGIRKPSPAVFAPILEAWGLPPGEVAMIGDTLDADILGAQLTGLHSVWLTAHADRPSNRAQQGKIVPEVEIAALTELPDVLARL